MPVNFSVTNQLASPAIYASSFATRPAASFNGRLFVDTNNPSTGIYRDTGTAWIAIAGTGVAETQDLNAVCTVGNTTTTLGIVIAGDSAIAALPEEGFALTVGVSGLSITTGADCELNGLTIGRGGSNLVENTAIGYQALNNNTEDGNNITAIGYKALYFNNDGDNLVALGYQALYNNTNGNANIGIGANALYTNNYGDNLVALGYQALYNNTEGSANIGIGANALYTNTEGDDNTAVGNNALFANTSGNNNTAIGSYSLDNVTEGVGNIGIGTGAGNVVDGSYNIFIGNETALTTTSNIQNVVIGYGATAPSGNNQFVIGSAAQNVGSVSTEVNASTRVWNVTINGVNRKILLA